MSYDQPDLFTRVAESVEQLVRPSMSYMDATLNYHRYKQPVRHGLCSFGDDDEPQMTTVVECSLPISAGITQTITLYGQKREVHFTLYGREEHRDAGELINWWIDQKNYTLNIPNKETEAGKWIIAHARELNSARRYWDAVRKQDDVERIEDEIARLQENLRIERLTLSVKVREAAHDRNMSQADKQLYLKELGAQGKDLIP